MTERKAINRAELAEDDTATVLAEALAGHRLSRRAARQLATSLRRVTEALPPGTGNLAGLRAVSPPPPTCSTLRLPHRLVPRLRCARTATRGERSDQDFRVLTIRTPAIRTKLAGW